MKEEVGRQRRRMVRYTGSLGSHRRRHVPPGVGEAVRAGTIVTHGVHVTVTVSELVVRVAIKSAAQAPRLPRVDRWRQQVHVQSIIGCRDLHLRAGR